MCVGQKQQIAEVFDRLVRRSGYAKATLDEVARELRIAKKTIYVHFDSKREIYEHLVRQQADEEQRRLRTLVADLPDQRAKAAVIVRYVLEMARAHVEETTQDEWAQEYEIAADAFRTANGELLREIVEQGMASGEFSAGDAGLVERMIGAMVLDYLQLVNASPEYNRDEELVERILRFIG